MKSSLQTCSLAVGLAGISLALLNAQPNLQFSAQAMPGSDQMMMAPHLAAELQGKPVVVDVYASWCGACKSIAPTLSQVQKQYDGKVNFVVFDVSNRSSTGAAQARAKQLGLNRFLQAHESQTGLVAIINPATGQVIQQFRGNANLKDYQTALNQAIQQVKGGEMMMKK
jgi:thiol-disulfide isomerase/thioredoxin